MASAKHLLDAKPDSLRSFCLQVRLAPKCNVQVKNLGNQSPQRREAVLTVPFLTLQYVTVSDQFLPQIKNK